MNCILLYTNLLGCASLVSLNVQKLVYLYPVYGRNYYDRALPLERRKQLHSNHSRMVYHHFLPYYHDLLVSVCYTNAVTIQTQ